LMPRESKSAPTQYKFSLVALATGLFLFVIYNWMISDYMISDLFLLHISFATCKTPPNACHAVVYGGNYTKPAFSDIFQGISS
ncbi:MAG: hypothetical protein WCR52_22255, partial [Bacteroidota bacterium]